VTGENNNNIIIIINIILILLYKHADSTAKWTITEPTQHTTQITNHNKQDTHEANSKQTKYYFNNNNNKK